MKRWSLYWCWTEDGDEDWFVVASSTRSACAFFESFEGYEPGDADAEMILRLPDALVTRSGWRDEGRVWRSSEYPSDELLIACGAEIRELEKDEAREIAGCVCKDVFLLGRHFRAGDGITNAQQEQGAHEARLSVIDGSK